MIASMTGYGKGVFANDNIKITVEIKSINSKQLDMMIRIPALFRDLETQLRTNISPILERGKVDVNISYEKSQVETPVNFNLSVLKGYKNQIDELVTSLNIPEPKDPLALLFRLPEAFASVNTEANEDEKEVLKEAINLAVDSLVESRIKEGKGLYEFFFDKIERIREYLSHTEKFEPERVGKIRERLEQQLSKLQSLDIDRGRLEQEMIYYIEKLDITEEKQRLRSHLTYFEETLGEPDEIKVGGKGKKLGFISQEIGREINTLGSKSNDADMQKLVVMMKDELEQIKEQVLNVL